VYWNVSKWYFGINSPTAYQFEQAHIPPVAFSNALHHSGKVHVVKVTGDQWYLVLQDGGYTGGDQSQANTKKTKLMLLLLSRQLWKIQVYSQLIHLTILN
jgi:hypothetical protein